MNEKKDSQKNFLDSIAGQEGDTRTKDLLGGLLGTKIEQHTISSIFNQSFDKRERQLAEGRFTDRERRIMGLERGRKSPSHQGAVSLEKVRRQGKRHAKSSSKAMKKQKTLTSTSQRLGSNDDRSSISFPKTIELVAGYSSQQQSTPLNKKKRGLSEEKRIGSFSSSLKRSTTHNPPKNEDEGTPRANVYASQNLRPPMPIIEVNDLDGSHTVKKESDAEAELEALEKSAERIQVGHSKRRKSGREDAKERPGKRLGSGHEFKLSMMIRQKSSSEMGDTPKFRKNKHKNFTMALRKGGVNVELDGDSIGSSDISGVDAAKKKSSRVIVMPAFSGKREPVRRMSSLKETPRVKYEEDPLLSSSKKLNGSSSGRDSKSPFYQAGGEDESISIGPSIPDMQAHDHVKGGARRDDHDDEEQREVSADISAGKPKGILKKNKASQALLRTKTIHELALSQASKKMQKHSPRKGPDSKRGRRLRFAPEVEVFEVESYKTYNKQNNINNQGERVCCGCSLQ